MLLPSLDLGTLEPAHTDQRRTILECNFSHSSVQYFTIHAAIPLGNHFHKVRHETFIIAGGKGSCCYAPVDKDGAACGETITCEVNEGSIISIQPFTAHAFRLEPGSSMFCFSSIPFDPENPDMFPYLLMQ